MFVDNSQLLVRWTDWSLIKLYICIYMCLCIYVYGRVFLSFPHSSLHLFLSVVFIISFSRPLLLFISFRLFKAKEKNEEECLRSTKKENILILNRFSLKKKERKKDMVIMTVTAASTLVVSHC